MTGDRQTESVGVGNTGSEGGRGKSHPQAIPSSQMIRREVLGRYKARESLLDFQRVATKVY